MACWITRSTTAGMPNGRVPPVDLGISTRLTGNGWYLSLKSESRILSQWVRANSGKSSIDILSIPGAPLLAFTRFQACRTLSLDSICSSRLTFGSDDSMTCRICAPPVGFVVLFELMEYPFRSLCSALHRVPGITPGVGLLWRLLTSVSSPGRLPCKAL